METSQQTKTLSRAKPGESADWTVCHCLCHRHHGHPRGGIYHMLGVKTTALILGCFAAGFVVREFLP